MPKLYVTPPNATGRELAELAQTCLGIAGQVGAQLDALPWAQREYRETSKKRLGGAVAAMATVLNDAAQVDELVASVELVNRYRTAATIIGQEADGVGIATEIGAQARDELVSDLTDPGRYLEAAKNLAVGGFLPALTDYYDREVKPKLPGLPSFKWAAVAVGALIVLIIVIAIVRVRHG